MGDVIDFMQYKASRKEDVRDGIYMEIEPPTILISHYRNGVVVKRHRVVSEAMLRDLIDLMN